MSSNDVSLVSIVMPSCNHRQYVTDAILSVYNQTYRPIELIIIDDGSTDGSPDTIRQFIEQTLPPQGISVYINARENRGAHATINEGITLARGHYIAILNSDDAYFPERIERCISVAETRGSRMMFTYVEPIDEENRPLDHEHPWRTWYYNCQLLELDVAPSVGFILLFYNLAVSTGNFVFRRDLIDETGLFEAYQYAHDLDFLMKVLELEEPVLIREPLYRYRLHDSNTITVPDEHVDAELEHVFGRYFRSILAKPPLNAMAPTFENWPSSLTVTFGPLTRGLNRGIDSLLETRPGPAFHKVVRSNKLPDVPKHEGSITLISHELSLTGAPTLVLEVARMMHRAGVQVNVVSLVDGPLRTEYERAGIPVVLVDKGKLSPWLMKWERRFGVIGHRCHHWRLMRLCFEKLSSVTGKLAVYASVLKILPEIQNDLLINSFTSWPVALPILLLKPRIRATWYLHESYDPNLLLLGRLARQQFKKVCERDNLAFLFGSEGTRRIWVANGYKGQVRYWSGLSADLAQRTTVPAQTDSAVSPRIRRQVLSVGTSGTRKGTRILIEAFALGRRQGLIPDDAELVIVGCYLPSVDPQTRDLLVRIHRPDLIGRVRLVGTVAIDVLYSYYAETDIYVQASTMECLPIAILQAMAYGLPIVTTDINGCKEAILNGICGITVPARDIPQLAAAIGRMLTEPEQARAFGEAARERFVRNFSLEATADPLLEAVLPTTGMMSSGASERPLQ